MSKQHLLGAVAALAVTASVPAFAGKADLTVKGSLAPSSCTATVPNGGVAFGNISASKLVPGDDTVIEAKSVKLSVRCYTPTLLALHSTDLDASSVSVAAAGRYGLGTQDGDGHKNGYFTLSIEGGHISGRLTQLLSSDVLDGTGAWTSLGGAGTVPFDTMKLYSFTTASDSVPDIVTDIDVPLLVGLTIADGLDVSAPVELGGEAMIDLVYL